MVLDGMLLAATVPTSPQPEKQSLSVFYQPMILSRNAGQRIMIQLELHLLQLLLLSLIIITTQSCLEQI